MYGKLNFNSLFSHCYKPFIKQLLMQLMFIIIFNCLIDWVFKALIFLLTMKCKRQFFKLLRSTCGNTVGATFEKTALETWLPSKV